MYQDRRVHAFMVACLGRGRPERSLTGTEVAATSRDEIDTLWVAVRFDQRTALVSATAKRTGPSSIGAQPAQAEAMSGIAPSARATSPTPGLRQRVAPRGLGSRAHGVRL
jgi:hypothetical protein